MLINITNIRRVFTLYPKWANVEANEMLALEACGNREDVHIGNEIEKLGAAGKLAVSPDYSNAYETFFQKHPEYRLDANVAILDSTIVHYGERVTAENLEELLLPGNYRNVLDKLCLTAEARQAQFESKETNRMISEITAYMLDASAKVKREYTQRQYNDKIAVLRAMPFSELVARYNTVMETRAQRKAPVEELRAVVKAEDVRRRQLHYEQLSDDGETIYYPRFDGDNRVRNLEPILANDPINLNSANIKRLHRDDLLGVVRKFGADAVNAVLAKGRN